jgi:hypothetical protein
MSEEQRRFLTLVGQAPGRVTVEQAACLLGCEQHDGPILAATQCNCGMGGHSIVQFLFLSFSFPGLPVAG